MAPTWGGAMLDHMTIKASDINKTRDFYSKVLPVLGYELKMDMAFGDGAHGLGYAHNGKTDTWFVSDSSKSGPVHIAWSANSVEQVNQFYEAALEAGGKDNGAPGKREIYHPNYYGAFVIDPDGNNIEAVFHEAE